MKKIFLSFVLLVVLTGCSGGGNLKIPFVKGNDNQEKQEEINVVETVDINANMTIAPGDTIWSLSSKQLENVIGDSWNNLDEASQTYLIDTVKDRIVDNSTDFGLSNPDYLVVGNTIDFTSILSDTEFLTEIQDKVSQLSDAEMNNIVENNEVISQASSFGISITNDNVDDIIQGFREFGIKFLEEL